MAPFAVVEDLDVLEEAAVRGLVVEPATMVGHLGLEQMEERLSYSVVPTVTLAHTLYETTLGDPLDEATAGVLDPTIRVDDQPLGGSQSHGSRPRRQHERGVQRRTQRPTEHSSRIQIDEDGQIASRTQPAGR